MTLCYLKYPVLILKSYEAAKKQKCMDHTQEKKQSVETVLEEDYMLDLLDKDFK